MLPTSEVLTLLASHLSREVDRAEDASNDDFANGLRFALFAISLVNELLTDSKSDASDLNHPDETPSTAHSPPSYAVWRWLDGMWMQISEAGVGDLDLPYPKQAGGKDAQYCIVSNFVPFVTQEDYFA